MTTGENIKKWRKQKGFTQEHLGKLTDLSTNTIQRYEKNKRVPTIDVVKKIAAKLNIPITELLGNSSEEIQNNFKASSTSTTINREVETIKHIDEIIKINDDLGYEYSLKFYNLLTVKEKLQLAIDLRNFISKQVKSYLYLNGKFEALPQNMQSFFGVLDSETIKEITKELNIKDK